MSLAMGFRKTRPRAVRRRRWPRWLVGVIQLRLLRTLVLISVTLGTWIALNYENLRELALAQSERDSLQSSVDNLQHSLEVLRVQREALNTNLQAIERVAREQYKMTMPGEILVRIERQDPSQHTQDNDSLTNLPPML
jgi:cell division protein FtsB